MSRFYHKWVSTMLIAAILATLVVIPDRQAFAEDRPDVEIVAVLVESGMLSDARLISVRDDLQQEFSADLQNISLAQRVRRYADDIQKKLSMSKVMIVPVSPDEEPWKIQESLAKLFVEGDGTTSAKTKLAGVVLVGSVPLPLVTKDGRSYISMYPYTDFEDPVFAYDFSRQEFTSRETKGRAQPEVWHGVIPYPVSWEQFVREQAREEELSKIRRENGIDAYTNRLNELRTEFENISREELAHYFDKNHSFYADGAYSEFSKKAVIMDFFREFQAVSSFALGGYQAYLDNWDNKSYMRYTYEWLQKLQGKYLAEANASLIEDFGENPDGSKKTVEQAIAEAKKAIADNDQLTPAEKERQTRLTEESLRQGERLNAALNTTGASQVPDIFTRDPIEQFLHSATEVFGTIVGDQVQSFANTGRWSMVGASGDREGHTMYKLVEALDETARKQILEVNTALEDEVDTMLNDAAQKSFHMQVDLPAAPINYFGRYTSFLYSTPKDGIMNWGDNFNRLVGQTKYSPGHVFAIDVTPSPPINIPINYLADNIEFLQKVETQSNSKQYIPYTGQKYTQIAHHVAPDKLNDFNQMLLCSLDPRGNEEQQEKCSSILFDNPAPMQAKYLELQDPSQTNNDSERKEVLRYETTVKLKEYVGETSKPDAEYIFRELVKIGDNQLINDFSFLLQFPPVDWSEFSARLVKHEEYLYEWNKQKIDFQVILHVIDIPFSAQQCTIYIGGAPEISGTGDTSYPLYLRGQSNVTAERQAANTLSSPEELNKNSTNLQNSASWRQEKVREQVLLSVSAQERRIRAKEMEIAYVQANPPRGEDEDGSRQKAWEERLKKLKEEREDMVEVKDYTASYFKEVWNAYYGVEEGDSGRFGEYLNHVGTLGEQVDLAKLVEANRLYNFSQDAIVQEVIKSGGVEPAINPATSIDPSWYGYDEDILRKELNRPASMAFPDWADSLRNGYYGGCAAPNLRRVTDTATIRPLTSVRAEMQGVFDLIRTKHIEKLKKDDRGALDILKYLNPLIALGVSVDNFGVTQEYYQTVTLYNINLFNILVDKMLMDDSYMPSAESTDTIEASVATFKKVLALEKDTLLSDMSEAEYNAIKGDLRDIIKRGSQQIIEIEKLYQKALGTKSPQTLRVTPQNFGITSPPNDLIISDRASRDLAREAIYDLVQGEYDLRLLKTGKIRSISLQALNSFAARVLQSVGAVTSAIDGEFTSILSTTSVIEALIFIGITCDPQRALEPIFDPAGAKTLNDPGYIPLRTQDNTVKIQDANTLAPSIVSGYESWEMRGQSVLNNPKLREYSMPPGLPVASEAELAPNWKEPVLSEVLDQYPAGDPAPAATQIYRDDYPRTRDEILYNSSDVANSYEQGWEYTRKGYNITLDQAEGGEKSINEGLAPETSYLACLRYAKFGIEPTVRQEENPIQGKAADSDASGAPYYGNQFRVDADGQPNEEPLVRRTISDDDAQTVASENARPSGWQVVSNLVKDAFSNGFEFDPDMPDEEKTKPLAEDTVIRFLREFQRRVQGEAGGFKTFPKLADNLFIESTQPFLKYFGRWDYQFDVFQQLPNALEAFFQKGLLNWNGSKDAVDYNDPEKRRELYSIYGVRRIATVVPHKEPTNETIARQLRSMSASSLPVNNPRYVDFYLYEPVPQFNKFGEVEKWNEYEEHISIPYINLFRAFPDDTRFAYAMQSDRSQFKEDLKSVEARFGGIVSGLNNYLVDYLAKTSLSGPAASFDAASFRLDTSSIQKDEVRRDVENIMNAVSSGLGEGTKNPQDLQNLLQGGSQRETSTLKPTNLEGVSFDIARFDKVLSSTSLATGASDAEKATSAKKELAFAVYWQHMTLAEKYKFVMHNYLTSIPDPEVTKMSFWDDNKVGFEAGTIILESDTASKAQLPLETLQGGRTNGALSAPQISLAPTTITERTTRCEDVYAEEGGSKYGVPIQGWGRAIGCWATNLWPLVDFSDPDQEVNLQAWSDQSINQSKRFAEDTGRFFEGVGQTGELLINTAGAAITAVGSGLDAAGLWLQDVDQDGLSGTFAPVDPDTFNPDIENAAGARTPNGFRDGQDRVKQLIMFSGKSSIVVSGLKLLVPKNEKEGVIPFGSGNPLEVHVALADVNGVPLAANGFDFVRLSILPEDEGTSVITIPSGEELQKTDKGVATFRLFAKNSSKSFGKTRITATLVRQQLPNAALAPEPVTDVVGEYTVTVTPEVIGGLLTRLPCTAAERAAGTCARGDVRDAQIDSIFSTNETAHQLSLVVVDMSQKNTLVSRDGKAEIVYYKDGLEKKNLYTKAMGGRESLEIALEGGAYAAVYAVPKESGKYYITITPEASLGLAPTTLSFLVVDTTYSTMRLEVDPPIAVEGQTVTLSPRFTNLAGEEISIGLGQASIGIPRSTPYPLDLESINARDSLPGGDTDQHYSIDVMAGKSDPLSLQIPDTNGTQSDAYTLDLRLSRIAPLSQLATQVGTDAEAETQRLLVRTPLIVYPKGALQIRSTLVDGSSALTLPAITPADQECRISPETNAARQFSVQVELRDKDGRLVPYDGVLLTDSADTSLFTDVPATVTMRGGKGSILVTPSRKSGTTELHFKDANDSFAESSITLTLTPGPLAALRFSTTNIRPLEAAAEKNSTPTADTMQALRYVGMDICGNPVADTDTTTIALDLQPPRGDGTLVDLLPLGVDGGDQLTQTTVSTGETERTLQTQTLDTGRNGVIMQAVNFRGEASLTVRALTKDASGKTVVNERILPDTAVVPIRMTLRKELIQSLEPNILYTNLLGGPYGDVTQKDFLGAWWMLTGKTQVVTTSTVASEVPTNLAKVLPNGALDIEARKAPGLNVTMFAEPELSPNMPFTVNIKDTSDGVTVMQVRYNIIPFISGAVFENFAQDISVDKSASLAPGIYVVPDAGITTKKDLLAKNRSVVRFLKNDAKGNVQEEAILADNLQFFPGGGASEMPTVVMNTDRKDIMVLRLQSAKKTPLATIYVKLDEQRVFPTDGDYARDVQLSLDALRSSAVDTGSATISNGKVTLSERFSNTLAEAERLAPTLASGASQGLRYLRKNLAAAEIMSAANSGIFTKRVETSLLRFVAQGEDVGLYIADRLLLPLRNLQQKIASTQEWLGANALQYQFELTGTTPRVQAMFTAADGARKNIATITPVYGATPLSWNILTNNKPNLMGWYQTSTQNAPYTYTKGDTGLVARTKNVSDIPGNTTARSLAQCTTSGQADIVVAGVLPTGETWSCFEALTWEKELMVKEGISQIGYLLRENAGTSNRIVTEAFMHFGVDRALPTYEVTSTTRSLISDAHQGAYVEIKDAGYIWNAEAGKIVRRDPLEAGGQGFLPVFSLVPTDFAQIPAQMLAVSRFRTSFDPATKYPTIALEEFQNGTWIVIATVTLQFQEKSLPVNAIATANKEAELTKSGADQIRLFLGNTNVSLREDGSKVRLFNGTSEIMRFETKPFRIESIASGLRPELLDIASDRFQMRLLDTAGVELVLVDLQTDARYTAVRKLQSGSALPQSLLAVPSVYIEEREPLLQMLHSQDRTSSRLMFGFEEVLTINTTGGIRVTRPDIISSVYAPQETSGEFMHFAIKLLNLDAMKVSLSIANLPFDLRVLTYLQDNQRPTIETREVPAGSSVERPALSRVSTGFLKLVGPFLDLRDVSKSLSERNGQLQKTTLSLPVALTNTGLLQASLLMNERGTDQSKVALRSVFVPKEAPADVRLQTSVQAEDANTPGLAITTADIGQQGACVRTDTLTVGAGARTLTTCRDGEGVLIREGETSIARIRHDGTFRVFDAAFSVKTNLRTNGTPKILYSLASAGGDTTYIANVVTGTSSELASHVRRGTPDAQTSARAGTYVSYIAQNADSKAGYPFMQDLTGVPQSEDGLFYCADMTQTAATCQSQLSFATTSFLEKGSESFAWQQETALKDADGYTYPAFGYSYTPSAKRIATIVPVLKDTYLRSGVGGNVEFIPESDATVQSTSGAVSLRRNDRALVTVNTITGALNSSVNMEATMWTPEEVRIKLTDGADAVGELRLKRSYTANPVISAQAAPILGAKPGMYTFDVQNTLQVTHDFPAQSSRVTLGYDTLLTLAHDGKVTLGIPSMLRTLVPNADENPLALRLNRVNQSLDIGESLVAFPLTDIAQKLRDAQAVVVNSTLQTSPFMRTVVDSFGNFVTEAGLARKASTEKQQNAQTRPVYAPTKPEVIFAPSAVALGTPSLPTFQLNPTSFFNATIDETYSVVKKDGNIYFTARSASPYWSNIFGADAVCKEDLQGGGVAGAILADGTRVLCDPLHTIDVRFDIDTMHFIYTLRTLQTREGVSSVIGTVSMYPGNMQRMRVLMQSNSFDSRDVAEKFAYQGLYGAIAQDYSFDASSMQLRLEKGDKAQVFSTLGSTLMQVLTKTKVWNGTQDRFYYNFEGEGQTAPSLTQRRIPLSWKIYERREVKFTEEGSTLWNGDLLAATMRLTLTDPTVKASVGTLTDQQNTPSFVCTPLKPSMKCALDDEGMVQISQAEEVGTPQLAETLSQIPALVFQKSNAAKWSETGLWNGSVTVNSGEGTGVARVEVYNRSGEVQAVVQYRPAMQYARPRLVLVQPNASAPILSSTYPEVQVLLARPGVRVLEKEQFFVLTIEDTRTSGLDSLVSINLRGALTQLGLKLQNADVLSFDGETVQSIASIGQFGLGIIKDSSGIKWTIGDASALLRAPDTWILRSFAQGSSTSVPALARGQGTVESLNTDITLSQSDSMVLVTKETPAKELIASISGNTGEVGLRASGLLQKTRRTTDAIETYITEERPLASLVRIGAHPQVLTPGSLDTKIITELTIVPANTLPPTLDLPGTAFIQPLLDQVRLTQTDQVVIVEQQVGTSWTSVATIDKRTLKVLLEDAQSPLLAWERRSNNLFEIYLQDSTKDALVRIRQQNTMPDLTNTAYLLADFPRSASTDPVITPLAASAPRTIERGATGNVLLFGNRLSATSADGGMLLKATNTTDTSPFTEISRQEKVTQIMELAKDRMLVQYFDQNAYQILPETLLPGLQSYTIYPAKSTSPEDALLTMTRYQPKDDRYGIVTNRQGSASLTAVAPPGIVVAENRSPVTLSIAQENNATTVRYGYDEVGSISNDGNIQAISPAWQTLITTAKTLRSRASGVIVEFLGEPYVQYMTRLHPEGYDNKGVRNTMFVEMVRTLGDRTLDLTLGTDRPTALTLGDQLLRWNSEMVQTIVAQGTTYLYESSERALLKFTVQTATRPIASLFIQTVADISTSDTDGGGTEANPDAGKIGDLPVDQVTNALEVLGGTGIYVQIKAPEKGALSLAYEPYGDSTNNLYAVALRDASMPLLMQNQINPATTGVEDVLEVDGAGFGYSGDFKNMLLFAGGNTVGESTLPYMSEVLINLGDPVISLKIEESDRDNESFTSDIGELVYTHTTGQIQQMVLYDIDKDGRKDIVFTDGDGKIQVVRNAGGNPVQWKYIGATFEIPEGVRELLVRQVDSQDELAVTLGSPTTSAAREVKDGVTSVTAMDASFVELKNKGDALLERCKTRIPDVGQIESSQFGDIDGDGTDDMVVITTKNEIKTVRIDNTVDCDTQDLAQKRYTVTTVDTIGMKLDGIPLSAPLGTVPQGYNLLPEGDIYARFNGSFVNQWNPAKSICPEVDPRSATPVYPQDQVPTTLPSNPEMVFIPEPTRASTTPSGGDPLSAALAEAQSRFAGSEGVYFSYEGGERLMRMFIAADLPYIRSGGQSLTRYDAAFQALAKNNPFSCIAGNFGGVGSFINGVSSILTGATSFLTGPMKAIAMSQEASNAANPASTLFTRKYAKDMNGGIIQAGDTIAYVVTMTNNLGVTKNIDLADRFQQGTDLLRGSLVCQKGTQRFQCTAQDSDNMFGLYVPNIEIPAGETLSVSYQVEVRTSPIPLSLQLMDFDTVKEILDLNIFSTVQQNGLRAIIDNGVSSMQKFISVTTPSMAQRGSFVYWRNPDNSYGADILKPPAKPHPILQIPVVGPLLESLGLIWNDDGSIATGNKSGSAEDAFKSTKTLNNILLNAFMAADRDLDGLIDLWDDDIAASPLGTSSIPYMGEAPGGVQMLRDAATDTQKNLENFGSKFDQSLDAVTAAIASNDCQTAGCGLVPSYMNTAFFAPHYGSNVDVNAMLSDASVGGIIGQAAKQALNVAADAVDWPVFAAPTATPPWFWPGAPVKEDMQLTSQIRVYFSITLSGRFALTACGGPYHLGMLDLPVPTGTEFNKNCYSYILPDLLNIQKLCQDIADGLSGVFAGLARTISSGGYTVARMAKAGNVTGYAENEANAPFSADQFIFETEKFKDPTANKDPSVIGQLDNAGKGITSFLKDFRQLGRGLSTAIPANSRTPGYPAFIIDWVERQIHEVLAKLLKLPTITLILPDPTLGFTRPIDPDLQATTYEERLAACSTEAGARGEQCSLTIMDGIRSQTESLSLALENGETEADLRKREETAQTQAKLIDTCNKLGGQEVCSSEVELNKELARLDVATSLNLPVLPAEDSGLPSQQAITLATNTLVDSLEEARKKLALLPDSEEKSKLSGRLIQIENATFNDMNAQMVSLLTDTKVLMNEMSKIENPETFRNAQLKSYVQLKESQDKRAQLAACNSSDPIACSMQNAEQTYSQFMNGVDLNSGASIADTTGLFNIGASSDQLLRKEVSGFSEILGIIGSLPFVSIRMRDVVFYYPWLPPDRISETLYHLEGVKNQSLSSFHSFYKPALSCFYETDAAGNTDWNPMLPPTFTLRSGLESSLASGATTSTSSEIDMDYCLAAARVGQDAWAGLQGIENNINRIQQYGDIMNSLKQYIQWKTYIVGRLLGLVTGVVGQISSYVRDQNRILASWRDTIRSISQAIASFQVIVDIFGDYQSQCTGCSNQRGTVASSIMDLLGNFIQLDVIPFPKWPDVEIDLSQINFRYDVVIPNIRLVPREFTLPRMSPILIPSLNGLPKAQLNLYANQGLNFSIPLLPALPVLPLLPELPAFRFPKLPDLPPPPKIPRLNAQVRLMIQGIAKVINIICLVQRNVLPIAEGRVRSHLEAITASNVLWKGKTATTPTFEPTLDVVRLSTQINVRIDTNRPFGQDTYMMVFDQAAQWWNQQMGDLISAINTAVSDIPSKMFGTAAGFVNREVLGKSVTAVNNFVAQSGQSLQASLNESISIPVQDFQSAVQEAVLQQKGAIRVSEETSTDDLMAQRELLASATDNDPATMYLVDQLIGLQESLITTTAEAGLIDAESFIPDLEKQIAFLGSDEAGLPADIRDTAVKRLQGIVDQANQPLLSPIQDADIDSLPYIQGWKQLETELAEEETLLAGAEVRAGKLTEATTIEEFQSALADLGMLGEEEFMDRPVASMEVADSQNTDAQRLLDTLSTDVAREVPMDIRDISTKKSITRITNQPAQVAVAGATGAPVASNIDITGAMMAAPTLAIATGVVTGPAVTQTTEPVREPRDNEVALGLEDEGAILVQLPNNGGLIALTNYTPPAGLPVQVGLASLSGRADYPDIVYTVGSDIFVKYNQYNRGQPTIERYTGADRIREVSGISALIPNLPAVMSPMVTNVENTSVTLSFDLPTRTRLLDTNGHLTGEDARYILRVYSRPQGRLLGETPTEFVILPVDAVNLGANSVALSSLMKKNEAVMPTEVREFLAKEALKQGLPAQRVLLGAVNGSTVQVTMPITNRNAPMFMTIVPRVVREDGDRMGLPSAQLFAHPQIGLDTTPPMVTVVGGDSQVVPMETPLILNATAEDGSNDVVDIWWDTDLLVDGDLDGNTANDRDLFCAPQSPCTVPLTTMSQGSLAKVPALNAPVFNKSWKTGERGIHKVKLFAKDAIGNTTSREIHIDVQPTEIRIDEFDEAAGTLRGSIYPVQANKTLQLLRVRDQEVSSLSTPLDIVTDASGRFTIEGLLPGEGSALYDASGSVITE